MGEHRDQIKFIIQRYDNYINAVNTKGNFLLAFDVFLAGFIGANYNNMIAKIEFADDKFWFKILLCVFFMVVLYTLICIFKAVYPFMKSGNSSIDGYHSLIFFNSVSEFKEDDDYKTKFESQTDPEMENDLILQGYQLAKGLKIKYKLLENAMIAIFIQLFLLAGMAIYLIIL